MKKGHLSFFCTLHIVTTIKFSVSNAFADVPMLKSIQMVVGTCSIDINGTQIHCSQKAFHNVLGNDHHLFNFAASGDEVGVSFAGARVDAFNLSNSILWVEHVYIANNFYNADGKCDFYLNDQKVFYKASCTALLRDGRRVRASISGEAKPPVHLANQNAGTAKNDCVATMKLHGLLSRAQFQCRYRDYSTFLLSQAKRCVGSMTEVIFRQAIANGMTAFDAKEHQMGHEAVCASILNDFSQYVRK